MHAGPPTEAEFLRQVIALAQLLGWLTYHTHDSRRSAAGFPDLVLLRERVVFAELKSEAGRLRPEQDAWIQALRAAGCEAHVWRPEMWDAVAAALARPTAPGLAQDAAGGSG